MSNIPYLARRLAGTLSEEIENLDLVLTVRHDMADWARLYAATPVGFVNPGFDPAFCRVHADNAFWIEVTSRHGDLVACTASKRWLSDDLPADLAYSRLWLERQPPERSMPLCLPEGFPARAGRFQHYGGLWVDPVGRGLGLSALLPRLARAIATHRWQPDWHIGWTLEPVGRSRLPRHYYGYARLLQATDETYWPPSGRVESCFLPWESATMWADAARRQLVPDERRRAAGPVVRPSGDDGRRTGRRQS